VSAFHPRNRWLEEPVCKATSYIYVHRERQAQVSMPCVAYIPVKPVAREVNNTVMCDGKYLLLAFPLVGLGTSAFDLLYTEYDHSLEN
jgi:hypothetical protein